MVALFHLLSKFKNGTSMALHTIKMSETVRAGTFRYTSTNQ